MLFLRCSAVICGVASSHRTWCTESPCQRIIPPLALHISLLDVKIIHYAAVAVLVLGVLYYLWMKPPSLNPLADRRSADALAMVQSLGRRTIPPFFRR